MTAVLRTERLGHRYRGGVWGLTECTIEVLPGSGGRLGRPNGSGKTTLLNMAAGLLPATTGSVRIARCATRATPRPDRLRRPGRTFVAPAEGRGRARDWRLPQSPVRHAHGGCADPSAGSIPTRAPMNSLSGGQASRGHAHSRVGEAAGADAAGRAIVEPLSLARRTSSPRCSPRAPMPARLCCSPPTSWPSSNGSATT